MMRIKILSISASNRRREFLSLTQQALVSTPLFLASQQNRIDVVRYLLEPRLSCQLSICDKEYGLSAFDVAASEEVTLIFKSTRHLEKPGPIAKPVIKPCTSDQGECFCDGPECFRHSSTSRPSPRCFWASIRCCCRFSICSKLSLGIASISRSVYGSLGLA